LLLVDSNVGFNKTDAVVRRSLEYAVDLSSINSPTAKITVHYEHTIRQQVECKHEATYGKGDYSDMFARCYWDYWRVYKGAGNELLGSEIPEIPGKWLLGGIPYLGNAELNQGEGNTSVFAGQLVLPTNESKTIALRVQLPGSVIEKSQGGGFIYRLRIQKQMGLTNLPVHLTIRIPDGYRLKGQISGVKYESDQTYSWAGDITTLQTFRMNFLYDMNR
jgi:hypothetical protein